MGLDFLNVHKTKYIKDKNAQCGINLVAMMSKLTNNAKEIFRANVTNSFQACYSILENAMPLSFKIKMHIIRALK